MDVWSAAVILYQMLYGKRPFGDGLTQEAILREDIMLNARQVTFPNKPSVSQEGKDFITRSNSKFLHIQPGAHSFLACRTIKIW